MTGEDSYRRGREFITRTNPRGAAAMASHAEFAPELERFVTACTYGEIYSRPGLDLRARQISTISMLVVLGDCEPMLEAHLHAALDAGLEPDELRELLLHCVTFAGVPRVLVALRSFRKVFEERGLA